MRKSMWLCLALAVIGLVLGNTIAAFAAESDQPATQNEAVAAQSQHPAMMGCAPGKWNGRQCPLRHGCLLKCALLVVLACHILLAAWVYTDIKRLGHGNGIFVALVLLAGIPAAILYALVRIGDKKGVNPTASP